MTNQNTILSNLDLISILRSRITSYRGNSLVEKIIEKEINDEVSIIRFQNLDSSQIIKPLLFVDCVFNSNVNVEDYQSAGRVSFKNCKFNCAVKVQSENSTFTGVCIFNHDLTIKLADDTEISNYNVKGNFVILGKSKKLSLKNINKEEEIINQTVRLNGGFTELIIEEVFGKILEFSNKLETQKDLVLKEIKVSELIIGIPILTSDLVITSSKIGKIELTKEIKTIETLRIVDSEIDNMNFQINLISKMLIIRGSFQNLTLLNSNKNNSIINIEKTTINILKFDGLYNYGLITLRELNIPKKGLVSFKSSNLGNADFINWNFSNANFEFENSKITQAFLSDSEFPKKVVVNGKINYSQAQLAFGQLATAFQKQGDNIRALEYNSRELEAHFRKINLFSSNFFQKINLWLNLTSNNFGRNWIRGVIFSFSIGLLFFLFLLVSTNLFSWGIPNYENELIPAYLKFMNPLRFFELENIFKNTPYKDKIILSEYSYLSDFIGRVFIAYGYYQTIQAFRRFGRK